MYTSPISRGITGRNGSPSTPKAVVDACKLAAVGWAKPASDPHYRVEVSDQQSTPGTKAPSNLSSNFLWGSCAISSTTTFAHHKDGSSVGSMHFTSVRLLKFPDEVSRLDAHKMGVAERQALTSTNNGVQGGMHSLLSLISEHSKVGQTPSMLPVGLTDETQEQKWSPTASRSKPSADPPANPQVSPLSESVFANIPDEFVLLEAGGQQRSLAEFLGDAALMGADPSVGEQTRMVGPSCACPIRADSRRKRRLEVAEDKVISWTSNKSQLRGLLSCLHSDPETVFTVSHAVWVSRGADTVYSRSGRCHRPSWKTPHRHEQSSERHEFL